MEDERRTQENERQRKNLEHLIGIKTEELRASEDRYKVIAEDTSMLICRFNPDGEIAFVNRAFCQFQGKSSEELIGAPFLSLIPAESQATVSEGINALTSDSPTTVTEYSYLDGEESVRWYSWTSHALFDPSGTVITCQFHGEYVTERKRIEDEKAKLAKKIEDKQ